MLVDIAVPFPVAVALDIASVVELPEPTDVEWARATPPVDLACATAAEPPTAEECMGKDQAGRCQVGGVRPRPSMMPVRSRSSRRADGTGSATEAVLEFGERTSEPGTVCMTADAARGNSAPCVVGAATVQPGDCLQLPGLMRDHR